MARASQNETFDLRLSWPKRLVLVVAATGLIIVMAVRALMGNPKKRRRWLRRLVLTTVTIALIVVVAVGILLANLKGIVLRKLQAIFPGLRVSVADVSLRSLSRLEISDLELSGERGASGSVLKLPKADIRFRFDPFHGFRFKSVDMSGARAFLRPGVGALVSSIGTARTGAERAKAFPQGPKIGRISLRNSRIVVNTPDVKADCLLTARADSSSTGTLLDNTDLLFRLQIVSLDAPLIRLRNLDTELFGAVNRAEWGKRIDVLRGGFRIGDVLRSDFRGRLSQLGENFETSGVLSIEPFSFAKLLPHLKESFPELDRYEFDGRAGARAQVRYVPGKDTQLLLTGNLSLKQGQAIVPLPKHLIVEDVAADLPFQYSILNGKEILLLGSDEEGLAGALLAAARVTYDQQELASGVRASFALEDEELKSLTASFRSHGGNAKVRLSGMLRDETVNMKGVLSVQDMDVGEVFQRLGIRKPISSGQVSGKARLTGAFASKTDVQVGGESSMTFPQVVIYLAKPLRIWGLEIDTPFEYLFLSNVQTFEIVPGDRHPSGGKVTAVKIGYGEKTAEDGTTSPQWTVSGFAADAVTVGQGMKLSVTSCRAYDGEVTGDILASLEKKVLAYKGKLHVQDLDLEKLLKGLGVKKEKFYMNGRAAGDIAFSGKGGKWDMANGQFAAIEPGGIIRIEDIEKLLESLPAGKSLLGNMKKRYTPDQWKKVVEGMKEFQYRVATASIVYPPVEPRPEGGVGPDVAFRFEGTGAGEDFSIKITVPITFEKEKAPGPVQP